MTDSPAFLDVGRPPVPDMVIPRGVVPFHLPQRPVRGRLVRLGALGHALLARHVRCGSARAVGQALRHNPFAPKVPCHRVIAADLRIGGFCGARDGTQIRRKRALLATEGVTFDAKGRLADPARVFRF